MKALAKLRTSAPAAVAMCLLYLTQQSVALAQARRPLPTIGALYTATCTSSFFQGFIKGLADLGYEDGKNVHIECRAAGGKVELLPGLAAELVQLKVDALLVGSCEAQFDAARHATSNIPIIVSACNDDLVANGVVGSLAHPGGNITGLSKITPELTAKRLEILQQLVPTATQIAVLWNSQVSASAQDWKELQSAAKLLKLDLHSIEATGPTDFAAAFKRAADLHVDAMITFSDGMTFQYAKDIASFALKYRMPVISPFREAPLAGALISYGPSLYDMSRLSAGFVVKVLKGEKPADIPIEQATRFEMVLNKATASALGLRVPASILARVDEFVE